MNCYQVYLSVVKSFYDCDKSRVLLNSACDGIEMTSTNMWCQSSPFRLCFFSSCDSNVDIIFVSLDSVTQHLLVHGAK